MPMLAILYQFAHFVLLSLLRCWSLAVYHYTRAEDQRRLSLPSASHLAQVCQIPKLPKHIAFILNPSPDSNDVGAIASAARLISYSVVSGLPCVTLYDSQGILKSNKVEVLKRSVGEIQAIVGAGNASKYHIQLAPSVSDKLLNEQTARSHINEYLERVLPTSASDSSQPERETAQQRRRRKIDSLTSFEGRAEVSTVANVSNVMLVSPEDGREAITRLTSVLAKYPFQTQTAPQNDVENPISNKLIHEFLSRHDGTLWPLPDFLVSFDEAATLGQFPPWLLRYAEIDLESVGRLVTYDRFLKSLENYAKCIQRHGK